MYTRCRHSFHTTPKRLRHWVLARRIVWDLEAFFRFSSATMPTPSEEDLRVTVRTLKSLDLSKTARQLAKTLHKDHKWVIRWWKREYTENSPRGCVKISSNPSRQNSMTQSFRRGVKRMVAPCVHTSSQSNGYGTFLVFVKSTNVERPQRRDTVYQTWVILHVSSSTFYNGSEDFETIL